MAFTNLDFDTVKANLKQYLKAQDKFKDYDFEGSNMNVLLDVLAYNTFQNNFYTNMAISEMFLDSAQVKDSIVSHAKELNYLPRSRRSSRAVLTIEFFPSGSPSSINIPERTKFIAQCGTSTYNFFNEDSYTVTPSANGSYIINNVDVFEGRYVDEYFVVDGTDSQTFVLQANTVDTNSIEVLVKESSGATTEVEWTKRSNVYNVDNDDTVFYLQPYRDNRYEIVFGDDVFGKQPINGNVIHVRYRVTNGEEANGIKSINVASDIDGISSTETVQTTSYGGAERETLNSIRFFAPKSLQVQERAVTENDYAILLQTEFPEIQAVSVYGGEKLTPPQFGRVVISAYINDEGIIREEVKDAYRDFLEERTSLAIEPVIQAAQFMYLKLDVDVFYNTNKTTKSAGSIRNLVKNAITDYSSDNLEGFKKTFKLSRLGSEIDSEDTSIVSNLIDVHMLIEFKPTRNVSESRILNFANRIKPDVTYTDAQINSYTPAVYSSPFTYQNKIVFFQDNGSGKIHIVQSADGEVSIVKRSVGTVNYTTGVVSINSLSIQDYTTNIKMYALPFAKNVDGPSDRILRIRSDDISVDVSTKRE